MPHVNSHSFHHDLNTLLSVRSTYFFAGMPMYYVISGPVYSSLMAPPAPRRRSRSPVPGPPPSAQLSTASGSGQSRPSRPVRNERSTGHQMTLEEVIRRRRPDREASTQRPPPGPQRTGSRTLQDDERERPPDPGREHRIRLADGIMQALREKVSSAR